MASGERSECFFTFIITVADKLQRRGLRVDLRCQSCGAEPETINHLLFICSKARQLWATSLFPHPQNGFDESSHLSNMDFLLGVGANDGIPKHIRNKFPWILWRIWKNRNDFTFEGKSYDLLLSAKKIDEDTELWFLAQQLKEENRAASRKTKVDENRVWKPPKPPWLKCNMGTSWNKRTGLGGASWVLRNHLGEVVLHSRRAFHNMASPLDVHLQTILWTIESMKHHHIAKVKLASENGSIVKAMHHPKAWPSLSYHHSLISKATLSCGECLFVYEAKHRNRVASSIATSVTSRVQTASYVATGPPSWLLDIISFDSNGVNSQ